MKKKLPGLKKPKKKSLTKRPRSVDSEKIQNLLNLALDAKNRGLFDQARQLYGTVVEMAPDNPGANLSLAILEKESGNIESAIRHMQIVVKSWPRKGEVYNILGILLKDSGRFHEAIDVFKLAVKYSPDNINFINNLGNMYQDTGEINKAIEYYQRALELQPSYELSLYNLGNAYKKIPDYEKALACYEKAISIGPENQNAHFAIARVNELIGDLEKSLHHLDISINYDRQNAKNFILKAKILYRQDKFTEAMESLSHIDISSVKYAQEATLIYNLKGKILDRLGETSKAYRNFELANKIYRSGLATIGVDPDKFFLMLQIKEKLYNKSWVNSWVNSWVKDFTDDFDDHAPVFLVGFPRSGTTLLDQILSSHSSVQVIEERRMIDMLAEAISSRYGDEDQALVSMKKKDIVKLRREYFDYLHKTVPGLLADKLIVDKYPLNITRIGLIRRIFPEARFILALRHPYDVCLSNFMQDYRLTNAMANFLDLERTARTYALVMGLWLRYSSIFELDYIIIKYENIIENTEDELKKMFDFLALEWDDHVLNYYKYTNKRKSFYTPSYQDISKPVFSHAKYRWKRYEQYLIPIQDVLAPFVKAFGYEE